METLKTGGKLICSCQVNFCLYNFRGKKTVEKKKRRRKKEGGDGDATMNDDDVDDDDGMEDMEVCEEDIQRLSLRNETDTAHMLALNGVTPGTSGSGEVMQDVEMDATSGEERVFKVTVGPQSTYSAEGGASANVGSGQTEVFMPSPRMNALLAVNNGVLYLYGGMFEDGDRQYTFSDFYAIDIHKLDEWNTVIENNFKDQVSPLLLMMVLELSLVTRKPVFGVFDQLRLKLAYSADETS